jgi:hypothetical protein
MIDQKQFDKFVENYNEDYLLLLGRAASRHYECLVSSFLILKDLYNVICTLYDNGGLAYTVLPYPLSLRADDQLLSALGFSAEQIDSIHGFLPYVRQTQGREFDEILESGVLEMCARSHS